MSKTGPLWADFLPAYLNAEATGSAANGNDVKKKQ